MRGFRRSNLKMPIFLTDLVGYFLLLVGSKSFLDSWSFIRPTQYTLEKYPISSMISSTPLHFYNFLNKSFWDTSLTSII